MHIHIENQNNRIFVDVWYFSPDWLVSVKQCSFCGTMLFVALPASEMRDTPKKCDELACDLLCRLLLLVSMGTAGIR